MAKACRTGRFQVVATRGALAMVAALSGASSASAQTSRPIPISATVARPHREVSLKDQLRVGLKATTKADIEFINLVVLRVDQGKLPRKVVDSAFLWARNRHKTRPASNRLRPIVYFRPAIKLQAKKLDVTL